MSARPGGARGMTFVELAVVAAIAGILATVAIPTGLVVQRSWQERQLRRSLQQIRRALDAYHLDWERGCIEADDETGWPRDLEELTEEKDLDDDPICTGSQVPRTPEDMAERSNAEPQTRRYLARIPPDPFLADPSDTHDTAGWKARALDDDSDATSWGGDNVYDVYSSSALTALDGTRYEEW